MSSFQIFDGASADQAFRVINMKKCKKAADIAVNDNALDILRATITTTDNVLDQPWAFAILFGKPTEAGFDEPCAVLEEHSLLHMTDTEDHVVVSLKYGGIEYSSWELVGIEDTNIPEPSSQPSDRASTFPTAGVPPRISTSKNSRHGSGIASKNMDARSRLRLKYEKQLQDKNLALWFALQKKHKSIAARKPRGTYKTTQEDYWLDVFMQVFPDMPDDERAARLTVLGGLEDVDGNGWESKWRSFASVQAYKPAEAAIDASIWDPVFSHLSKGFDKYMPDSVVDEQPAKPTRVYPSGPFPKASPLFASQQSSALGGFDKPKFEFLTNKQAAPALSSAVPARKETSSPHTSVLQQPLPLFSAPSLFSEIGSAPASPNRLSFGKTFNKTLPLGLQKPWKGVNTSAEPETNIPFVFDTSKLSGTVFSPQAAATTTPPFVFGASSKAVAMSETYYATDTDEESEDDSFKVNNGILEEFLESEEEWENVWPTDDTEMAQVIPAEDAVALEETSIEDAQLAPYTVGEYLTDNITHIFRHSSELSRTSAIEKYAELNAHYGVGLSSPCPPTWTRPSSLLKWSEVVENFETDFVELTMPGATQSEKDKRVTFLMRMLKASMGGAWDSMDDVVPLPAGVEVIVSQDGDKFEDDDMCPYVNGYDLLALREYDASRSDAAITDEQYAHREPAPLSSSPIEVTIGRAGDKFEDDAMHATSNGYDLLAQREYDASRTDTAITDEQFARIESPLQQLEVTISQAGDKFEDDVMYGTTNGYELLAQCEYDLSAIPRSSPLEITIGPPGPMFEDDAMYGGVNGYELLAQREYYSTDGEDESDGYDTSLPLSIDSPASSPERPLSPDDGIYAVFELRNGIYAVFELRNGKVHLVDIRQEIFELDGHEHTFSDDFFGQRVDTHEEVQSPAATTDRPGPLTFDLDVNGHIEVAIQDPSDAEQDTLVVFDEDSAVSDNETVVASDDEDFGYATIATKAVPPVPSTHKLNNGPLLMNLEPFEDMQDWVDALCDKAFAPLIAPQLPMLQFETTAFSSLFDSDMLFGTTDTPEDPNYILPELSDFSTPSSPKICNDEQLSVLDLAIDNYDIDDPDYLARYKEKLIADLAETVAEIEHEKMSSLLPTILITPPEAEHSAAYYRRINEAWAPTPKFTRQDHNFLRVSEL